MLLWTLRFWLMLENVQQVKALPLNRKKVFIWFVNVFSMQRAAVGVYIDAIFQKAF